MPAQQSSDVRWIERSDSEVATLLDLGLSTVETHRANLMQKLNLHNTAEIVLYAVRKGLIV